MNKNDFEKTINATLKNVSLEKQISILEKIRNVWIPAIIHQKTSNKTFCENCKKYSLTKQYKFQVQEKEHDVPIFSNVEDDGPSLDTVKFIVKYRICPKCGCKSFDSQFRSLRHSKYSNTKH